MPYVEIDETDGQRVTIVTAFADRHLMRELPGATYVGGAWRAPLSWPTCVTLRGLFGDGLVVGELLAAWARGLRAGSLDRALAVRELLDPDGGGSAFGRGLAEIEHGSARQLYPYQRVDVEFLTLAERALLGNEPGLGKTGVVLRTLQALQRAGRAPFPALVVCPNSLKFTVWADEAARWAPELAVRVVDGGAATRRRQLEDPADVYVINWEALRLHSRLAPYGSMTLSDREREPRELNELAARTVVLDEAHRAKDPHAQVTRAAWAVAHQARYRFALTGTPIANHLGDLWSVLHLLDPNGFPGKTRFMDRYARTSLNFFGGAEVVGVNPATEPELRRVLDPMFRRVPKALALPQLPPMLPIQYRHTPMSASQARAYRQIEEHMIARLDDEVLVAPTPLVRLTRLLQFASSSARIDEETGEVRLAMPSAKVDDLMELLEELGDDEPLVVAAESRQLIELAARRIAERKITYGLVTGAQSPVERKKAVDRFQGGSARVILMTLGAGAEGLTLTRASKLLFMQRSWSLVKNTQAAQRIHRPGAERHAAIQIIEQITPGTVEERRLAVLDEKDGRAEEILRDRDVLCRLLGAKEAAA